MRFGRIVILPAALVGCIFSIDEGRLDAQNMTSDAAAPDTGATDALGPETGSRPDGLIGHWSFEEAGGTVAIDTSGRGHDGILRSVIRGDGISGKAISTNVNAELGGGWFEVPHFHGSAFPRRGTLSAWIRVTRVLSEDGGNAFLDQVPNTGKRGSWLVLSHVADNASPDSVHAGFVTPNGLDELHLPTTRNAWNHIVIVWGEDARLYSGRQGEPLTVKIEPYDQGFDPSAQEFVLMKRMLGELDEVRLYDRPLADADVRALP